MRVSNLFDLAGAIVLLAAIAVVAVNPRIVQVTGAAFANVLESATGRAL